MKRRFSAAVAGAGTLAATAGIVLLGATAASASVPYEPDPNAVGTIGFFNSSGVQITSGNITDGAPLAAYAAGSVLPRSGDAKALLQYAQPDPTKANSTNWNVAGISALANSFPVSGGSTPADIAALSGPVVVGDPSDNSLETDIFQFPNTGPGGDPVDGASGCAYAATPAGCTTTAYQNLYQLRLLSTDGASNSAAFDSADVTVNPSTGAWTQSFGQIFTSTAVQSSSGTVSEGTSVTFTAHVSGLDGSTPTDGTVQFKNGAANLGTAQPVNASGVATLSTSALTHANSPYTISAVFTPGTSTGSAGLAYGTSTAPSITQNISAPATATNTTLTITGDATTGTPSVLSGSVSPTAAGNVSFFDNGSSTPVTLDGGATSVAVDGSGNYTANLTAGWPAGSHSVVAQFTSTDPTFANSASGAQNFTTILAGGVCTQSGSQCTDTQNITASIPTGTLIISTPYTAASPLDFGPLALNPTGTAWTGQEPFDCIVVTDTNGVNTGFVANALASSLTLQSGGPTPPTGSTTSISGENVGLTGLVQTPATSQCGGQPAVNTYTGNGVTATNNPAASPPVADGDPGTAGLGNSAHQVLTGSPNGVGTATWGGTLTLNAPTSTAPGTYNGTIVFTVSDGN